MTATFGSTLRAYRMAHGLTQEALAERALLSPTAIAALERGRNRTPRMSTLRQLARALDLSPDEMAGLARTFSTTPSAEAGDPLTAVTEDERGLAAADRRDESRVLVGRPAATNRRWRTTFVGRHDELERLRSSLANGCRLVEVVGESGIGKTRIVSELVRDLDPSITVSWGRCSQDNLGSYLPFVEIIRHITSQLGDQELATALGGRGELTRLVPELVSRSGPLALPTRAEAESEQRILFEAVAGFLARWRPTVLVVDDLHWADPATLALFGYLVRDYGLSDLTTVITARPTDLPEGTTGLLAELGREVSTVRVRLDGLGETDVAGLVSDLVGSAAPSALVASVQSATDGNPLFAEELTVHLLDTEFVVDPVTGEVRRDAAGATGVPERVRDMVARRLLSLTPEGLQLLTVGAVIGREFDLPVAALALGMSGLPLVDAADDALLSGMVAETGPARLGFSHALLRDAVTERLSRVRLVALHRAVATAMEQATDGPSEQRAAELARHWATVAEVDPSASVAAATWSVRAGDQAMAAAAADEAIARYEQAVTLWSTASAGHVDSLIRLGTALHHCGRADEADERFTEAIALALATSNPNLQARAAIGLGRRYPYWETDSRRTAALEAALASLPPEDTALEMTLMGLLVTHLINGFEPEEASRRDALAMELSVALAAPDTETDVLLAVGQTRVYDYIEDPATLEVVADRLLAVADARNDLRVEAAASFAKSLAALDLGRMAVLQESSDRYAEVADKLGDPRDRSQAAMIRSTIAFVEGRYDRASELSEQALELGRLSGDYNAELINYAQGLLRGIDQGLASDVLPLLLASSDYQVIGSFDAGTALCAALAGDTDEAQERLARLSSTGFVGRPRGADFLAPTAFLAHTAVLIEDRPNAEVMWGWLQRTAARVVRVGPLAGWWGPVDHHLGCLAHLLGRPDEAEARLRDALAIEGEMHAAPFAARTRAQLAAVVSSRSAHAAIQLAAAAVTETHRLGIPGVAAEVQAILERAGLTS